MGMELTEEMMARITSNLMPDPPLRGQPEARLANRFGISICLPFATIHDGAIGDVMTVLGLNVSRTGLAILSSTDLSVGQEFVIWLPSAPDEYVSIHCQVARRDLLSRTSFLLGAIYTRMSTVGESSLHASAIATTAP